MKFKYLSKRRIKSISLCLTFSITSVICLNGLPHDSKKNNTKQYNFQEQITYNVEKEKWKFDSIVTNEGLKSITTEEVLKDNGKRVNLEFNKNNFITDLSVLEDIYDEIREITIKKCPGIVDLTPLYSMPNLEQVNISECAGVTEELVCYLDSHGIMHNISNQDLENRKKLESILNEVINDDMSDIEKIKAISLYLVNNYCYDIDFAKESNLNPMTCLFEHECGVCISFAYVANCLYNMSDIEAYKISGSEHGWNLVKVDDKYYYVDVANMKKDDYVDNFMINNFNRGKSFMTDPGENSDTLMIDYFESEDKITIPGSLAKKIEKSEDYKNVFERNPLQTRKYSEEILQFYLLYRIIEAVSLWYMKRTKKSQIDYPKEKIIIRRRVEQ